MRRPLPWPGCRNARDLGDLPGIRQRALIRSEGHERLTAEGRRALLAYGVSRVIDLRLPAECERLPSPFADSLVYRNVSVLGSQDVLLAGMGADLAEIYRVILDDFAAHVTSAVVAIAQAPPGGVVLHCHSGRDRTGLVTALALRVAGVSRVLVAEDYALTAAHLGLEEDTDDMARSHFEQTRPETMLATLDHLDGRYGGALPYLLDHGMREADVRALRGRLCAELLT
ncbi:tyrosine-protein phosphatase [Streptosporangium sp. NPDC000396]|uniref:tyrosine-protein phosphatase n=1 Tax=Streptosporangium sp. NPDC000396 TaxID=3366185 RepID=UPI0036C9C3C3